MADVTGTFTSNARALDQLLRDLAVLFTYDESLRRVLPDVWRRVMTTAFDALEAGADLRGDHDWSDSAFGRLLPTCEYWLGDAFELPNGTCTRRRRAAGWAANCTIYSLPTCRTRRPCYRLCTAVNGPALSS